MAVIESVTQFLGPNALSTLVTGVLGMIAGAWLTSRRETKRDIIAELNSISAALLLCHAITNKFLSLKRQHVRDIVRRYESAQSGIRET